MPTLSNVAYTLSDHAKALDPNGSIARLINLLSQMNEIVEDVPFMEGNLEVGHQTTVLTGLPAVAYRMMNAGTVPTKDSTAQITEQTGMLDAWSQVDVELAKLGGNEAAFRMSKVRPFLESMVQTFANRWFYGNTGTEPAGFTGLSPRYSSLSAGNAQNIINMGGSTNLASAWLLSFGEESLTGIFPKGSTVGLQHENKGITTIQNANGVSGALLDVYLDHWIWKHGLCLTDWRYAVRCANIDVTDLDGAADEPDLIEMLEHALELLPTGYGTKRIYMNRTLRRHLRRQARVAVGNGGGLTYENFDGKRVLMFGDVPVRTVDQLVNAETAVA